MAFLALFDHALGEKVRIALLEDDKDQAELVHRWLADEGHQVSYFDTADAFLREVLRDSFDLALMDWVLPGMGGIEALERMRRSQQAYTPVLFMTAKSQESSIVEALEAGADDYMVKPLRRRELLARIKAASRNRTDAGDEDVAPFSEPYEIDLQRTAITLNGESIDLTHREFDLALFLFRNAGRVISRPHLLESIWGMQDGNLNTRTVDTHASRIRKKLALKENGWKLSAIYQHGYRLEPPRS